MVWCRVVWCRVGGVLARVWCCFVFCVCGVARCEVCLACGWSVRVCVVGVPFFFLTTFPACCHPTPPVVCCGATGHTLGHVERRCFEHQHNDALPEDERVPASDVYMMAPAVASKMLEAVAHHYGFNFEETLTGFKWAGNKVRQQGGEGTNPWGMAR